MRPSSRLSSCLSSIAGRHHRHQQIRAPFPKAAQKSHACALVACDTAAMQHKWHSFAPRPSPGSGFQVTAKTITGQSITLDVKTSDTIGAVKAKIRDLVGISTNLQKLVYAGKVMQDDRTLADYIIRDDRTLHIWFFRRSQVRTRVSDDGKWILEDGQEQQEVRRR